ncbi:MAG: hypothetical protein NTW04_04245, partial [Elusimicrobia bacterium]|nr:hypothetical protein [Elusimicrobiota bacterium]
MSRMTIITGQSFRLNKEAESLLHPYLERLQKADFAKRLWEKDSSLWKTENSHKAVISNSLG